jgi:tetratricopeptide (TPR) repeat protein
MSEKGDRASDTTEAHHLLVLAHSRPAQALAGARELLARRPRIPAGPASAARQAAGIALRDLGHPGDGRTELRHALRLARSAGDPQRQADVRASLGVTMALAGQIGPGLVQLDQAARAARGVLAGRVLMRRASILVLAGRRDEALADLNQVVAILHRDGDYLWEARSRSHRGLILLETGRTRQADADFAVAEQYYRQAGQEWEYATARHNRGLVAAASGRIPQALAYLAEADQSYRRLGTPMLDVAIDRCAILLAAGLAADAWAETAAAAQSPDPAVRGTTKFAELLHTCAVAALAAGDPAAAQDNAGQAAALFRRQRRAHWSARTRLVLAQARYASGERSPELGRLASSAARQLDGLGADETTAAQLLAGLLAARQPGRRARAERYLAAAARPRRSGPALSRSRAWLARALLCQLRGQYPQMLAACRRGLAILAEQQQFLGATELRVAVTAHGRELAALGQRAALARGDGRQLVAWSERWRATAQATRPVRLPRDGELGRELAALREVSRRLDLDLVAGPAQVAMRRERARLEASVRGRVLRTPGPPGADAGTGTGTGGRAGRAMVGAVRMTGLLAALAGDGAVLAELVEVDGVLHAVTVGRAGVRLHTVGPAARAAREVDFARFLLRRLADGRPVPDPAQALAEAGDLLQQALLGHAAADLGAADPGDGPVVVVPPGRLSAVPWGLLPVLRDRPVSVCPSAAAWLRARAAAAARADGQDGLDGLDVTLVGGPGLAAAPAELARLSELYPKATVLAGGTAMAERVLAALDGCWLAHVAAHGTFRADNPLFSALQLDDGPLTGYDLEGMDRGPHRLVLSACESARATPAGADELLGLASSLMPMGTAGIVAAVVPVSDLITPEVMGSLHLAVTGGAGFPGALRQARADAAVCADPAVLATACSFVALGV